MGFLEAIHRVIRWAVVAGLSATTVLLPATAEAAGPYWNLSARLPTKSAATLNAATAASSTELWAVGSIADPETGRNGALVGRYAGDFRQVRQAQADPELDIVLGDVDTAGDDVWAVGRASSDTGSTRARIERYDRRDPESGGQVHPGPSPDPNSVLRGIDMLSAGDGWAVGASGPDQEPTRTLIVRWDGAAWSHVPSPSPGTGTNQLDAVAARAPDDVWAVGHTTDSAPQAPARTLVLHWDGIAWTRIPSPDPATGGTRLLGVAVAGNDVWAVGYSSFEASDSEASRQSAVAMRWDGRTWHVLQSQSFAVTEFNDVTATSETDVWLVGCAARVIRDTGASEYVHIEHWDGTELQDSTIDWHTGLGHVASALYGITARPPGSPLWAVGWLISETAPIRQPALFRLDR